MVFMLFATDSWFCLLNCLIFGTLWVETETLDAFSGLNNACGFCAKMREGCDAVTAICANAHGFGGCYYKRMPATGLRNL